jgi:hypothetical protein
MISVVTKQVYVALIVVAILKDAGSFNMGKVCALVMFVVISVLWL